MLKISGTSALSVFRINKLLAELQAIEPAIKAVSARFMHFVDIENDLDDRQAGILKQLLAYGSTQAGVDVPGPHLLVVPRPGTISPGPARRPRLPNVADYPRLNGSSEVLSTRWMSMGRYRHL
jgi:hypothetical protein